LGVLAGSNPVGNPTSTELDLRPWLDPTRRGADFDRSGFEIRTGANPIENPISTELDLRSWLESSNSVGKPIPTELDLRSRLDAILSKSRFQQNEIRDPGRIQLCRGADFEGIGFDALTGSNPVEKPISTGVDWRPWLDPVQSKGRFRQDWIWDPGWIQPCRKADFDRIGFEVVTGNNPVTFSSTELDDWA